MTQLGAQTVDEFCKSVGLSKSATYALARKGQLVIRKIGRRSVITNADMEAFLGSLPPAHAPKKKSRG